ncbi:MAG: L-serine ammonia-lyase, iron-sulfur-dependent, subunit beta [Ekhidna sp.]|nr:L-serine ammonia-lyase, iron-sulfur-dependent, subunit beta [Ekhidna sp.]MBC6410433.1 L-serine ammonia-lyase, iron-sulfur-dependent, subunit beta [Ekhidna sp.]MBC6425173.1 L-serine ammonia-lyase, iron-sulfur-dependent, subunit beta [Ekhidna sp.]
MASGVFDMIGPVMIGPSSSHTAGVVRIGRVACKILGGIPEYADIVFYNSFARTYEGHGSNRAILAGLMDYKTDDVRIKNALSLTKSVGLSYKFRSIGSASTLHPNSVRVSVRRGDSKIEILGESQGGGVIRIKEVNGFDANFTASLHTLIIEADDVNGSIAFFTEVLSQEDCNIATMTVSRKGRNDLACLILEMDSGIDDITLRYLEKRRWVHKVNYLPDIDK